VRFVLIVWFSPNTCFQGPGYRLTFQGKELVFPNFERGPSEFIMSQDYSAYVYPAAGAYIFLMLELQFGPQR
jgi:hypothetical protein